MEQIKDKISVITICYNCADDLEKTILSVSCQTYRFLEFIVVDGGSTDSTRDVLKKHSGHIDICISEQDKGIYDALNKGIERASGEWIVCMNAGDVFCSESVLAEVFSTPVPADKSFIYSDCTVVMPDGRKFVAAMDRRGGNVHHQNSIYRRRLHERYGYYSIKRPYIVSDVLFFLAVPEELFLKTDTLIAMSKFGGISCALWSTEGALGAKLAYGMISFPAAVRQYLRARKDLFIQNLKRRLR